MERNNALQIHESYDHNHHIQYIDYTIQAKQRKITSMCNVNVDISVNQNRFLLLMVFLVEIPR